MSLLQKGPFTAKTQSTQRLYYVELCTLGASAVSFCSEVKHQIQKGIEMKSAYRI